MSSEGKDGGDPGGRSARLKGRKIVLHDNCLRDDMHPKRHRISIEQMIAVAEDLYSAGVAINIARARDGVRAARNAS
jgi:4-hydroxy-2-oxovalerate/4-hydroxy-2-oxohexanoate aldolase